MRRACHDLRGGTRALVGCLGHMLRDALSAAVVRVYRRHLGPSWPKPQPPKLEVVDLADIGARLAAVARDPFKNDRDSGLVIGRDVTQM
jgi:hypothetical protein